MVLRWCKCRSISLCPVFIPRRCNVIVDVLSRECVGSEWNLHPEICRKVFQVWGSSLVDLFATALTHCLPLYVSRLPDQGAWRQDAFSFPWDGLDLYVHSDLLCSVSCPPRSSQLPAWDLSLVLWSLLHPPYKPLQIASLRDVSLKTMFLLALASARQVSGLYSLSAEVCHSKGWTSMTFSFASDFLAKTQCPGQHSFNEFTIPALLDFVRKDKVDRLLT
ncbi:hypothetical protein E2C01_060755 [Portunus trituberculatus]|uniref:Uncharacterized protein n=1 Tax=Portunus trituberculatus TaxID=210409 RepID=A0A5B7HD09_PORTR|nr:hypothetical protein [Portunus trituberculatus]